MSDLMKEKTDKIAKEMGWALAHAKGYLEGERYRRRNVALSAYHKVGIDEYALGFRTGYYKKVDPLTEANIQRISSARKR